MSELATKPSAASYVTFKLPVLRMNSRATGDHEYVAPGVSVSSTWHPSSTSDPSTDSLPGES